MKKKIKEIILKVKLAIVLLLMMATMISGIIAEMWPKTEFNYPLAICAVCGTLMVIVIKLI